MSRRDPHCDRVCGLLDSTAHAADPDTNADVGHRDTIADRDGTAHGNSVAASYANVDHHS